MMCALSEFSDAISGDTAQASLNMRRYRRSAVDKSGGTSRVHTLLGPSFTEQKCSICSRATKYGLIDVVESIDELEDRWSILSIVDDDGTEKQAAVAWLAVIPSNLI